MSNCILKCSVFGVVEHDMHLSFILFRIDCVLGSPMEVNIHELVRISSQRSTGDWGLNSRSVGVCHGEAMAVVGVCDWSWAHVTVFQSQFWSVFHWNRDEPIYVDWRLSSTSTWRERLRPVARAGVSVSPVACWGCEDSKRIPKGLNLFLNFPLTCANNTKQKKRSYQLETHDFEWCFCRRVIEIYRCLSKILVWEEATFYCFVLNFLRIKISKVWVETFIVCLN